MVAAKGGSKVERAIKIKMQDGRIVFEFVVMAFSVRNCCFFLILDLIIVTTLHTLLASLNPRHCHLPISMLAFYIEFNY